MIASALAQAADILLLDEPTASLDLGAQLDVAALLQKLHRERAVTIVMATHDLNFAASVCDTLVLMKGGRVLAHGPTANVLTAGYVRELYGVDVDVLFNEHAPAPDGGRPEARAMTSSQPAAVAARQPPRRRPGRCARASSRTMLAFGALAVLVCAVGAARRHDVDQPRARVRSLDSLPGQRRRADLLRRAPASGGRRGTGGRGPGGRGRRVPGAAAQPAGDAVHAGRLGRRLAGRDDRDHLRRVRRGRPVVAGADRQPGRRGRRFGARLPAGHVAGTGDVHHRAAARRA